MPSSTLEADASGHHRRRRSKRPSTSLAAGSPVSSHPRWIILGQTVARQDSFSGDGTTSAMYRTSAGDEVTVSLNLVEPPGTSVITLCCPHGPSSQESEDPDVIAAHRDVILLKMASRANLSDLNDHFVYTASSDTASWGPSLLLLPVLYDYDSNDEKSLSREDTGILSCGSSKKGSPAFIVAVLENSSGSVLAEYDVHVFRSGSDNWEVFRKVYVHGANGGQDLFWWATDAVVPYRRRFLIWVDYYRGMIVADMIPCSGKKEEAAPKLWYVRLPVDTIENNPYDSDYDRGYPEVSRSVCATCSGIKFVSVDHKESSSFGVGNMRTWTSTFRITTWSLHEEDYTWGKETAMDPDELWAALDCSEHRIPRVAPQYPVVNMENPDRVCFLMSERSATGCNSEPTWMIEVDMKKKVLLGCTAYPRDSSLPADDQDTIKTAIRESQTESFISSEIPRYLYGRKACKKRRQ
ncbi:unnamed protein product [Urochloa humidicola]